MPPDKGSNPAATDTSLHSRVVGGILTRETEVAKISQFGVLYLYANYRLFTRMFAHGASLFTSLLFSLAGTGWGAERVLLEVEHPLQTDTLLS